ncbi:MAG TPA: efflux RND transporter permease subunit [Pseudomonadales bacterium]
MNFVTWSIRNPVPVIMMFIALTIAGLVSFPKLGVLDRPDIEFPAIVVTVTYSGVAPSQMESEITRRVEDSVATLAGIEELRSTVSEGASTTVIQFVFGTDMSRMMDEVRDALTRIRSDLPQDANEPIVSRTTTAGLPVVTWSVASDKMTDTELSWFVDLELAREMTAIPGVGRFTRVGGVNREIRVDLNPDRIAALGTTATDVSRQLRRIQAEYPGGEARLGGQEQTVRTTGLVTSVEELKALPVLLPDGRNVRLDTLADVRDQASEQRAMALYNGTPVVGFEIVRAWGASALDVAKEARAKVEELKQRYPDVTFAEASSTVEYIQTSYDASMEMLIEGAILAVLVVFVFLRDWRATLISAAALPLSIIPTFWLIYEFGYTLNILTLVALTLVVGILVDDAIVEVENIVRHLRMGKSPRQAAMDAAIEIGLAVVATTLTICAVFIPVAFMGSIAGEFFRPFGFTVAIAVLFSLLVARMLTPMMAAYMLKPSMHEEKQPKWISWYLARIHWCLQHRWKVVIVSSVVMVLMLSLFRFLPTGFAPAGDNGFTQLSVELPPGATIEETYSVAEEARRIITTQFPDEVRSVFTTIGAAGGGDGFGGGGSAAAVRSATLTIQLDNPDGITGLQQEFEREATDVLRAIPGAKLTFGGAGGDRLEVTLVSDNPDNLRSAADAIEREMRSYDGLGAIDSSAALQKPEIVIRPDPERAAALGVTTEAISQVTRIATSGDVSNGLARFNLDNRQIPIRVRLNDAARSDIERLSLLDVPGSRGPVPLINVADVSLGSGPAEITRVNRSRNITLSANLNGLPLGDMLAQLESSPAMQNMPDGVEFMRTGDARFINDVFSRFFTAMIIGVMSIYAVLVILFHKFVQPLTILSALPPSAAGAVVSLLVAGYGLAINSLIGLLMLMGIVTKNSILLVEYAIMAQRDHGMSRTEAVMDSCAKRARPIVMTSIAMSAGMLPVALGLAGDPSFRAPIGVAVLGGLIVSTVVSLFIVPVFYTLMDDMTIAMSRRFGKWFRSDADKVPVPVTQH